MKGHFLVTGCAGFIGSKVTEQLLEAGNTVVGVDNLNDAYDVRLKNWRLARLSDMKGFEFKLADISRKDDIDSVFADESYEGILNLAARAGVRQSIQDPMTYFQTNTIGTLNLLEACRLHDIDQFLLASTSSLYGSHNEVPFNETANTDLPLSPYAASKKGAEAVAATHSFLYGINAAVPRYFTVYGPAGRPEMSVFRFIKWISEGRNLVLYGDGNQTRDFTYVDDIARGTILAMHVKGFEIINLGNDSPSSLNDIIAQIEQILGRKAILDQRPFQKADVEATWADISKARNLLGWIPEVSFEEGLRRTVGWHQEHHAWLTEIETGED